ncbi:MAG: tRNA (N(6)-L-threonylcarbamoyladenosine(37)-C(2))-methylthiotransferase MtaB [Bacteroidetes bacterium]|nr:tRNA (N(6)-L-threonylcarbamoyladenosine(37)-C(2))-methylthiotransferase MtaB [Bacteroidota bacterium]
MQQNTKTVAFHTLGCKLNFSETSTIARVFQDNGYVKVDFANPADIYVINTCSVTENADKECKQIVKSAKKRAPDSIVVIVGCYAQLKPNEILQIEGVNLVLGAKEKFNILQYIESIATREDKKIVSCEIDDVNTFVDSHSFGDRTRVFLKVQDGCDYTCSFCTIPLARGKSRSGTVQSVVERVQKIAQDGIKEIVLTGVNLGDFGKSNPELKKHQENFFDLVKQLENIEDIERYRISSIEPNLLTDEIIQFVSGSKKFVPHFHIPLQSGSNKVLKLMRRRYLRELYESRVQAIKSLMPHCAIGVDVIVGFPGETEEDFLETYKFLNSLDISYLHVFTYSERDNTDALSIKPVVPYAVRKQRNNMLRILSTKKQLAFYNQFVGTTRKVLFETETKDAFIYGYSDNYLKIKYPFEERLTNQIVNCKLTKIGADGVFEVSIDDAILQNAEHIINKPNSTLIIQHS